MRGASDVKLAHALMVDVAENLHVLAFAETAKERIRACESLSLIKRNEREYAKQALEDYGLWGALLDRLIDPEEDVAVFEAALLCMAELFTPISRAAAAACQKHLRLAAEVLIQPHDALNESSNLPCQLAFHLLDSTGQRVRALLAIARISVALTEHLSMSSDDSLLASDFMQALMVAVARPVGGNASSGMLCALALFHLILMSPRMLFAALQPSSSVHMGLLPSLCMLERFVCAPGDSKQETEGSTPVAPRYQVRQSDCVAAILHVVHMSPWVRHQSVHKDTFSKLVRQRAAESKAVACFVSYMEQETSTLQEAVYMCAATSKAAVLSAMEATREQITDTKGKLDETAIALQYCREELHRLSHIKELDSRGDKTMALAKDKARLKEEKNHLRHVLVALLVQQRMQQQQEGVALPVLQQIMDHGLGTGANAALSGQAQPCLGVLLQAVSTLSQLASPLITANKGPDPELDILRASIHQQILHTQFLPASLELATTAEDLGKLVWVVSMLISFLNVGVDMLESLGATEKLLYSHIKHLNSLSSKLPLRMRQVTEELHRIQKAQAFGTAKGRNTQYVPLTPENTLCSGIRPKDLAKRSVVMEEEEEMLKGAMAVVAETTAKLEKHLTHVKERHAALSDLLAKTQGLQAPPGPDTSSLPMHSTPSEHPPSVASPTDGELYPYTLMLRSLSGQLPALAFPERAIDHLHDLILPPYTTAAKQTSVLAPSKPSAAAAAAKEAAAASQASLPRSISAARSDHILPGTLWQQQQLHQGLHQVREFKTLKVPLSQNFHTSPPQSPRSQRRASHLRSAHPLSPRSETPRAGRFTEDGLVLGPELEEEDLIQEAKDLLAHIHTTTAKLPTSSPLARGLQEAGDAVPNGLEMQPLGLAIVQLCQQCASLEEILCGILELSSLVHGLSRASRLLPARCSFTNAKTQVLTSQPELLPDLMANFAFCIASSKSSGRAVAQTVAEIASKKLTGPDDYVPVYVDTGIIDTLMQLVCGGSPSGNDEDDDQPLEAPLREVSRYTLVVPTLRPSQPGVARQGAAAAAITAISKSHPQALYTLAEHKEALASLCNLVLDNSQAASARLSAAALLSVAVCAGTQPCPVCAGAGQDCAVCARKEECARATIEKGAFSALLMIMDSDHRQGSDGAKAHVIAALVAIGTHKAHQELIVDYMHAQDSGEPASSPRMGTRERAAAQRLISSFKLRSDEHVQESVMHTLWDVPLQLVALLSSDTTKSGRTVDPSTVAPLYRLSEQAAKAMTEVVAQDAAARRIGRRMGIASKINVVFLQAIKDADLQEALVGLKRELSS